MKKRNLIVVLAMMCNIAMLAQNENGNNGQEQNNGNRKERFPGGQGGFPDGQNRFNGEQSDVQNRQGGFPGFPGGGFPFGPGGQNDQGFPGGFPGGPGGFPFGPGMMDFKAINQFGLEFHDGFVDEKDMVVTAADDSTRIYFVENQKFDGKLTIRYAGNKVKIDGVVPDGVKVKHEGSDVTVVSRGKSMEYVLEGKSDDGYFHLASDRPSKLVLNGVDLRSNKRETIDVDGESVAYIVLSDGSENRLEDRFTEVIRDTVSMPDPNAKYETEIIEGIEMRKAENRAKVKLKEPKLDGVIKSDWTLCFSGHGRLTLKGHNKNGITSKRDLVFRSGNVISMELTQGKGVSATKDLRIYGGVLNVDCSDAAKDGIRCDGNMWIDGGWTVVKSSGAETSEGIEAKYNLIINGGVVEVASFDDGINSGGNMIIRGGRVFVGSVFNDALDSNSNLVISGGDVTAFGGNMPECGLDANEEERFGLYILGGRVFSMGGMPSRPARESRQGSVTSYVEKMDSGTVYNVVSDGKVIMSGVCKKSYPMGANVLFSSPKIEAGKKYDIKVGN